MKAPEPSIVKTAKPFVKWVGGKSRLLPQLISLLPERFNTYYEPFLGGGAMFFYLQPEKAVINDINKTLIHTYKVVKDSPEKLCESLCRLEKEYLRLDNEARKNFFYQRREEFNSIDKPNERKATLMIFLNKTCFNGMYRENSKGMFNVPFGDYKNPKICNSVNLQAVSRMLRGVNPVCLEYKEAVKDAEKGDFIYFDPPYHPLNQTSNFTSYSIDDFNVNNQRELRDLFVELDKKGCYVMLSNSASEFIKDLYKDYRQEYVLAGRAINSKGTGRGKIKEIVVLNYK